MNTRQNPWLGVICLILFVACQSSTEPKQSTQELLLPVGYLPSGWVTSGPPHPMGPQIGFGDEDDSYVTFHIEGDEHTIARHFVLHYPSASEASHDYLKLFSSRFNNNSIAIEAPWETPPGLIYSSAKADQFHMACTINSVAGRKQICEMIAQYTNYNVIFYSHISENKMSLSEFNSVIQVIDDMMVKALQLD